MTGTFSMRCSLIAVALLLGCGVAAEAQGPTFNLGSTPAEEELRPPDAAIGPDGEGLPPGRGTATEGALVYRARGCAKCHGSTGTEGPARSWSDRRASTTALRATRSRRPTSVPASTLRGTPVS